jgi:hypothetical protein
MISLAIFSSHIWTEDACLPVGREDNKDQLESKRQLYSTYRQSRE